ncbi:Squamous cell carcinoma antigen recognized by T-cells 3 [Irineochytrium annulatum]|nr:Squamous cell carcinoma antigen recognized by T-cells 3 [Irineochytrium annulatum]
MDVDINQPGGDDDPMETAAKAADDLLELYEELSINPLNYDTHVRLIASLRALGMADELRAAREQMQSLFPLTDELWMEWLEDEKNKANAAGDEESRRGVMEVYAVAVQDYLSIPLWKDYAEYVTDGAAPEEDEEDNDEGGGAAGGKTPWLSVEEARAVCAEATRATELHFAKSHIVWGVIKDFELRVLEKVPTKEQEELVRSMFLARLKVPHAQISETFSDYSPFESKYNPDNYEERMKAATLLKSKAEEEYDKRDAFEMRLSSSGTVADYLEYIAAERANTKHLDKKLVRTLFERAVAVHYLDPSLWELFITYMMTNLKAKGPVTAVAERAVRNCSWSGMLWALRIRAAFKESSEELQSLFKRSISFVTVSNDLENTVLPLKAFCDYERSNIDRDDLTDDVKLNLRSIYNGAIQLLKDKCGGDPYLRLERAIIRDEIYLFKDLEQARARYENLLKENGSDSSLWVEAAHFERDQGNVPGARSLFRQCVNRKLDYSERVFEAFLAFEAEVGHADHYFDALAKVRAQEKVVQKWRLKEQAAPPVVVEAAAVADSRIHADDPMQISEGDPVHGASSIPGSLSKRARDDTDEPASKRHKASVESMDGIDIEESSHDAKTEKALKEKQFVVVENSNGGCMIHIADLDRKVDEEKLKAIFGFKVENSVPGHANAMQKQVVDYYIEEDDEGKRSGFLEFRTKDDATAAANRPGLKVNHKPVEISRCIPKQLQWNDFDAEDAAKRRKIYVSNLEVTIDKPTLRKAFAHFGKIREIRVVYKVSIAFAYVEFEVENSAEKACALNNTVLEGFPGRRISVAISNPALRKERAVDKCELFVNNFTLTTTKEALSELFSKQYGLVKDVRLLKTKEGLPRGAGFIEFTNEADATKAMELNGYQLDGRIIAVTQSDPNVRKGKECVFLGV